MEHRIRGLERNIRIIMDYLHLDYEEPCKVCGKQAVNTCALCGDRICTTCDIKYESRWACSQQCFAGMLEQTSKGQPVQSNTSTGSVQFFSPNAAAALAELGKRRVPTDKGRFVPVEDGFITTAGNKERGAMYGNTTGSNRISYIDLSGPPRFDKHL
jgi:hypothetical protein